MKKSLVLALTALPMSLSAMQPHHGDSVQHLSSVEITAERFVRPATVSKIAAPAREIPVTVSQVGQLKLREMNFTDLATATRDVPGVNSFRDYGGFHMFFVRGFYETVVLNDGIRDERHVFWQSAPITGLSAVERIEFIKGSASMTAGHSALGGVVNVVYKQPSAKPSFSTRFSVGSWDSYHAQIGFSRALTNRVNMRADAELRKSDGWRGNFSQVANARVALDWNISSAHKLSFSLRGNKDSYGGDYGIPRLSEDIFLKSTGAKAFSAGSLPVAIPLSTNYSDPEDILRHKSIAATAKWDWSMGKGWRLSNYFSASHDDIDYHSTDVISYITDGATGVAGNTTYEQALSNSPYRLADGKSISLDYVNRELFAFAYTTTSLQNQLEITGTKHWGNTKHSLLGGYSIAYLKLPRFDRANHSALGYTAGGAGGVMSTLEPQVNAGYNRWEFTRRQHFSDMVNALYIQDYMTWGKWNVLASLRGETFRRQYTIDRMKGRETVVNNEYDQTTSTAALTYRFGLVYNFSKELNVYLSTSNFYRPQRFRMSNDVVYVHPNGNPMTLDDVKTMKPLTGESYEVGARYDLGNKLSLSASAYYISLRNLLNFNLGVSSAGKKYVGIAGRSVSKGLEFDALYSPHKMVDLSLGYSYTDARIQEVAFDLGNKEADAGNRIARIPDHKLNAWVFGNFAPQRNSTLRLGIGLEHVGLSYTTATNQYSSPAFTLMHALASYKRGPLTLQLNANNLFDTEHYRTVINAVQYIPGEGRNLTLTIGYDL